MQQLLLDALGLPRAHCTVLVLCSVVLRLGTITGASTNGHANTTDFVHVLVCTIVLLGAAPAADDTGGVVEMYPVDLSLIHI